MSIMHCSLLSLGCAFGFAPPNNQTSLTAVRSLKVAQRRLRPEVRAKLLSVSSARTDESLIPVAWRFVFFDAATSGNCRVVTVAAKTSSEHPDTIEAFSSSKVENVSANHAISQNKLLVDSDKMLEQARGALKLKGVGSAEYHLVQSRSGQEPVWIAHFYADKEELIGRLQVGAKTGAVQILGPE